MRFFLSFMPFSRREADHAAERVKDVMADLSWGEMCQALVMTALWLILLPNLVLVFAASEAWV